MIRKGINIFSIISRSRDRRKKNKNDKYKIIQIIERRKNIEAQSQDPMISEGSQVPSIKLIQIKVSF